jgi:hypothetical protein
MLFRAGASFRPAGGVSFVADAVGRHILHEFCRCVDPLLAGFQQPELPREQFVTV